MSTASVHSLLIPFVILTFTSTRTTWFSELVDCVVSIPLLSSIVDPPVTAKEEVIKIKTANNAAIAYFFGFLTIYFSSSMEKFFSSITKYVTYYIYRFL